jgi:hypothetical protein
MALVRHWYQPHLERLHDNVGARAGDLDQLEQIARTYPTRGSFLSELTLDPPEATGAEAVPPHLSRALDDPLCQGERMGRRVRAQRDRRLHPFGHGGR